MSNVEAIKKALEGVDLRNIDQNTNERVWLSCANEDGEHASWFDPGEGGTPYIRADLVSTTLEALQREKERLQTEIDRKSSMPGDHRYWEGRYRDEAAENERLRERIKTLGEYADEKTAVAFRYMMDAERVGDLPFKEIMTKERDAYSDMTMQLRTALASAGEHHAE